MAVLHVYLSGIYWSCVFEWGCLLGKFIGVRLSVGHMYMSWIVYWAAVFEWGLLGTCVGVQLSIVDVYLSRAV